MDPVTRAVARLGDGDRHDPAERGCWVIAPEAFDAPSTLVYRPARRPAVRRALRAAEEAHDGRRVR